MEPVRTQPSIALTSQVCRPNCALFPAAAIRNRIPIMVRIVVLIYGLRLKTVI
jgi:hypothetical protein